MKTRLVILFACAAFFGSVASTHAQIPKSFAFGIKAGGSHMNTKLVNKPSNLAFSLTGVRGAKGYQMGVWSTIPLYRWAFLDTDLSYSDNGHERYLPPTDSVIAEYRYRYVGLSVRPGVTYRGAFLSFGPEVNILTSEKTRAPAQSRPVEWRLRTHLGYQYRRIRAEVFYTKSLTPYDQNVWDAEKDYKTLFYGSNLGFSVGLMLTKPKK